MRYVLVEDPTSRIKPRSAAEIAKEKAETAKWQASLNWKGIPAPQKAKMIKEMYPVDQEYIDEVVKYNITDNFTDHVFDVEVGTATEYMDHPGEVIVSITPKKFWDKEDCIDDRGMSQWCNVIEALVNMGILIDEAGLMESTWESNLSGIDAVNLMSKLGMVRVDCSPFHNKVRP